MTTKDDENRGPAVGKSTTMIVPGGDLDAVASEADGRKASSEAVFKPPFDNSSFDVKRIMAPGGDLDAIDLDAGIMGKNERPEKPVGPAVPFRPQPAGDEKKMMFRDRGTFVDSGPDERDARGPQSNSRTTRVPDGSARHTGTPGFRFRDGTDDDAPLLPGNFHDGEEDAAVVRPFFKPETDPGDEDVEAPVRHASVPRERADAARETAPRAPDVWEQFRSPALKNAPRPRNDDPETGASGDNAACLDVSTAQLEAVIQRIMERVFVEKVEAILQEVLKKAVEKEMRNFRSLLVKEVGRSGGFRDESMDDGTW